MDTSTDILILGGGLAGSAAATVLTRAGRKVTLVEREATPRHKVCGEFLSAEALHLLHSLGIDAASHGASPVHTVRIAAGSTLVEAPLPFAARSLTRRCLDGLLLRAASDAGAELLQGLTAESLTCTGDAWQALLSDGRRISADKVILATGKHDLRGFPRPRGLQNDLVALKMYFRLAPEQAAALGRSVELLLHPSAYTGLEAVEDGTANLSALVRRRHLARLGGWPGLFAELQATNIHAARRLNGAEPLLARPLAISALPYGFVRRHALAPGVYAVGDQAAVIPSFTGDGMSIALFTGCRAAQAILERQTAGAFQQEMQHALHWQVLRATALSLALVQPLGKTVLLPLARLWPGGLATMASLTRISAPALQSLHV